MTTSPDSEVVGNGGAGYRPGLIGALALTQTAGYGVLYYAFGVLLGPMSDDLTISTSTAAGALTVAVLVTGAMSIPVGRWLDARGGHALMTAGSTLAVVAVVGWSQVDTVAQLYAVFVVLGLASAMVLYPAATAVLVAVTAPKRRASAVLTITLVAGFASSIFIPLTGQLVHAFDWRQSLLILAALYGIVAVPLHAIALRGTGPRTTAPATASATTPGPGRVLRDPGFWLLGTAFVLHSAGVAVVAIHLVMYLVQLGHAPQVAAGVAGLLGVFSVTGRVTITLTKRWVPMIILAAGVFALQGMAIAILPFVGQHLGGVIACVVAFGLGFGVASITTPVILLDRYGSGGYGTIAGILGTPMAIARATAPLGAAFVVDAAGYRPLIALVAAALIVGGGFLALTRRVPAPELVPA